MKKLVIFIFLILIAIALLAYFDPEFRSLVKEFTGSTQTASKVYKWKDKDGNWQITDAPPPAGVEYTEQEYLHDTNVMPPIKKQE
jgi:hypothetical protein